jgi:hypothetical protein
MGDAMVGVADDQFARLTSLGVTVGKTAGLIESAAPDRSGLVWKVDLPVTMTLVLDADEGVGDGWHTGTVSPNRAAVIRDNCVSARQHRSTQARPCEKARVAHRSPSSALRRSALISPS